MTLWQENLTRLVDLIDRLVREADERCGARPDWFSDRAGYAAWDKRRREELEAIKGHLTSREGARFSSRPAYECALKLAGIRSSCTGGEWGVLQNWQAAARRKIGTAGVSDDGFNPHGSGPVPIEPKEG